MEVFDHQGLSSIIRIAWSEYMDNVKFKNQLLVIDSENTRKNRSLIEPFVVYGTPLRSCALFSVSLVKCKKLRKSQTMVWQNELTKYTTLQLSTRRHLELEMQWPVRLRYLQLVHIALFLLTM